MGHDSGNFYLVDWTFVEGNGGEPGGWRRSDLNLSKSEVLFLPL